MNPTRTNTPAADHHVKWFFKIHNPTPTKRNVERTPNAGGTLDFRFRSSATLFRNSIWSFIGQTTLAQLSAPYHKYNHVCGEGILVSTALSRWSGPLGPLSNGL